MPHKLTKKQVKSSLLDGKAVKANNWEISINDRDEVVIFPPKGDGFSTTLAHLDRAVDDYCKKAATPKPGSKQSVVTVGPDSESQNLLKSPSIKKRDIPSGGVKPDMAPKSEDAHPFTPKPRVKSPEVGPAPGGGGMPSEELGPDSDGDIKWGRIKDTFMDDSSPTDFYRELKAKKPSAELLKDITNERKWTANNLTLNVGNKRVKAGPKLREKWNDKGYDRDIEAESAEELHALTRAFGGEEVDWSSFKQDPVETVEAEGDMGEVVAAKDAGCGKGSESDVEAVDQAAKDYYEGYFKDDDYGKQLVKDDVTDKRKRDRGKGLGRDKNKDEKKAQAAPVPTPKQPAPAAPGAPPAGGPAAPAAPGAPPGGPTPGAPKPGTPGEGMKPGTGDAGLQALGWTPEDVQFLDEEDKQKILQIQLNKPGTKQPKPAAPPKGGPGAPPGGAEMALPAAPAPGGPGAAPAPQKPVPAPVAYKMAREIMRKLKFKKAQQMLTQEPAAPAAPAAPAEGVMPEFQAPPQNEAIEGATVEQQAFQILSEVQQMPVQATTPESVPPMKAQELSKRLLTELGMPIEEAKNLFGVSKSGQGLISLFK